MNQSSWAIRARARLQQAIDELESPDAEREIIGLCVVAVRLNTACECFATSGASLSPLCEPNQLAAALLMESEGIQRGEHIVSVVSETVQ